MKKLITSGRGRSLIKTSPKLRSARLHQNFRIYFIEATVFLKSKTQLYRITYVCMSEICQGGITRSFHFKKEFTFWTAKLTSK